MKPPDTCSSVSVAETNPFTNGLMSTVSDADTTVHKTTETVSEKIKPDFGVTQTTGPMEFCPLQVKMSQFHMNGKWWSTLQFQN